MAVIHAVAMKNSDTAVIFIHGVDGDWSTTWRSENGFAWPNALSAATDWSSFSVEYDAYTTWGRNTMPLEDRAENILDLLSSSPMLRGAKQIAMICHSFGGLVAKALIRKAWERRDHSLLDRINAIVFLGTPHEGSGIANILDHIHWAIGSTVTVEDLRQHQPALRILANWYRDHHAEVGIRSLAFFETQPLKAGPVGVVVVDSSSGTLTVAGAKSIPIDADHVRICKPSSDQQQQFVSTELFLRESFRVPTPLARLPQQFAAVCYRVRDGQPEFLLTHTTSGLWTFPKGRPDPGRAGFETAENEAFEEAGVRGVIEPEFFTTYLHAKRGVKRVKREDFAVLAYLLEVRSTEPPPERDRNPDWFSAAEAKRELVKGRELRYAKPLEGVIDLAVARIAQ